MSATRPALSRAPAGKGDAARERIIKVAVELFFKMGFDGASMRDIAAAAKMQPASLYYHFPSKEDLLWAVWEKGGIELKARICDAISSETDPWKRLLDASVAHIEGLLDWEKPNQVLFIMPPWQYPANLKDKVIALRDEYERIFVDLIADLPLAEGTNRRHLRLALIGALSWPLFWYKRERGAPRAIAESIVAMLRSGVEKGARR
jgi:TetR/AcrR family transcriptional regulator, cholesterol catabolism regulator